MSSPSAIAGLVLAGGKGSRLRADVPKPLVPLAGRPLIVRVLGCFPPDLEPVLINANEAEPFAIFGHMVIPDRMAGFPGPLGGLDAGAAWISRERPDIAGLVCLPSDTPFLPQDVVMRLVAGRPDRVRLASFADRIQPTVGFWPLERLAGLRDHIAASENRSVIAFAERHGFDAVVFRPDPAAPGGDPFFNVNMPEDLVLAERWLSR